MIFIFPKQPVCMRNLHIKPEERHHSSPEPHVHTESPNSKKKGGYHFYNCFSSFIFSYMYNYKPLTVLSQLS